MNRVLLVIIISSMTLLFGCANQNTMDEDVIAKFRNYQVTIHDIEQHQLNQINKEKAKSRIIWYMIYEHAVQQGYPTDDINSVVTKYISDHTPSLSEVEENIHRDAITELMGNIYNEYSDEVTWNESYQF